MHDIEREVDDDNNLVETSDRFGVHFLPVGPEENEGYDDETGISPL